MKTIKIFSFPCHQTKERTSGVDFARVLQPMKYLNGYSDGEVKFEVTFFDINAKKQDNWLEISQKYDLVFLNYTVLDWQYAAMGACMRGNNKKIVMDLDDAVWYVGKDNMAKQAIDDKDGGYLLKCILGDVDVITTTNYYLKNVIMNETKRKPQDIVVFPNQVDLSLYNHISPAKDTGEIILMHYGSSSHFEDQMEPEFVKGMDRIFNEYPNVRFKAVGSFIQSLKYKWGKRYEYGFGDVDLYKWVKEKFPGYMDEADIMVVPLRDNIYNRAKSDIKTCEVWSAQKPVVCSDVRPYTDTVEHGKTGFLCKTSGDWYSALKQLIDSRELRQTIGQNGYNYVKDNRQIQNNIRGYADLFKKLVYG